LTPGEVRDQLDPELAYTTVMTILSRLHGKGLVHRERAGRAYVYSPAVDAAEDAAERMRGLLDRGIDREAVLAHFIGSLSRSDERVVADLLRRPRRSPRRRG
jgi:predicted transcriptional regulator